MSKKSELARQMLRDGKPYAVIAEATGLRKGTISYHASCLGLTKPPFKYDWEEVQKYHDLGHSRGECIAKFGFGEDTWTRAARRGNIKPADFRIPLDSILIKDSPKGPAYLKRRVLWAKLIPIVCYACGLTNTWNGKPINLWLDHINGDGNDWRIENLRMVCPNCDSQSETYAGRNVKRLGSSLIGRTAVSDTVGIGSMPISPSIN